MGIKKITFTNKEGLALAARLEHPADGKPRAYAILAHVFTGNKNLSATRYIARCLTQHGIAVLRFDFAGLGESEGDFAETNFSSNVSDLLAAADYLGKYYESPQLLVGHSLGGASVIFAAAQLDSIRAIATIGTPSEPEHVTHLLSERLEDIEESGMATVSIGGRSFTIKKQFIDDLREKNMYGVLRKLKKPILVMHSPQDAIVEIDNAAKIYQAAYHPKSFISLDGADHMLSSKEDAHYVGNMVASWLSRYIEESPAETESTGDYLSAHLGPDGYTTEIMAGRHALLADESSKVGAEDLGPSPFQLLLAALSASTAMYIQHHARAHGIPLQDVDITSSVDGCYDDRLRGKNLHAAREIHMAITLSSHLDPEQLLTLKDASLRCPIARSITTDATIQRTWKMVEQ